MWDAVLQGVRIVLSTHQVLLDALTHGFVRMGKLALLIFDEGLSSIHVMLMSRSHMASTSLYSKASRSPHHVRLLCTSSGRR